MYMMSIAKFYVSTNLFSNFCIFVVPPDSSYGLIFFSLHLVPPDSSYGLIFFSLHRCCYCSDKDLFSTVL